MKIKDELKKLSKRANQRLVRLEKKGGEYINTKEYKDLKLYNELHSPNTKVRFKHPSAKMTDKEIKQELDRVTAFLNTKSTTIKDIDERQNKLKSKTASLLSTDEDRDVLRAELDKEFRKKKYDNVTAEDLRLAQKKLRDKILVKKYNELYSSNKDIIDEMYYVLNNIEEFEEEFDDSDQVVDFFISEMVKARKGELLPKSLIDRIKSRRTDVEEDDVRWFDKPIRRY